MKTIILSLLTVAMIGLTIPSISAQEQVPDWVKNNAGWWADDQIDDSEFLNAITYLIKNKIINHDDSTYSEFVDYMMYAWEYKNGNSLSTSAVWDPYQLNQDHFIGSSFYRPPATHGAEIFIRGDISSWNLDPLERMTVRLVYPDGNKITLYASEYKLGKFDTSFNVNFVSALGKYQITVTIDNETYNFPSIMLLDDKTSISSVPAWIKNNAGWWADGQIPDSAFMQGIQFLINHKIIILEDPRGIDWWADDQIDDSEFSIEDSTLSDYYDTRSIKNQNETKECSSDYPYKWSDGNCWNVPEDYQVELECTSEYPYMWSDGYCYTVPECSDSCPYRWSDGMCYNLPEDYQVKLECPASYPHQHSDGYCYECPEENPYKWSDGGCHLVPEPICPAGYHGPFYDVENNQEFCCPNGYFGYSDGTCRVP